MLKNNIQAVRGIKNYLPTEVLLLQLIEKKLKTVLISYGYNEIRLSIIEKTALFKRAIGDVTDIVEKEMYTFIDLNGDSLSLRPEGTAGCVRTVIEHGLLYNQEQRLWYIGPMFRRERPQMGRYRQFHQLGVEVFGHQGPNIDIELILLTMQWWRSLGINKYVSLEINSLGSSETRKNYREALISFLAKHKNKLDDHCRRQLYSNPIRILDSKNLTIQDIINDAPIFNEYLDRDSKIHFNELCKILDLVGITYKINPHLVRGLDYYNRTVFEWSTNNLGSQGAICGGGRYDGLAEQLGGQYTPAIGCAVGLDRLLLLVNDINPNLVSPKYIDIYIITIDDNINYAALLLAEKIHNALPLLRIKTHYGIGSVKKKISLAFKLGAQIALILGKNEVLHFQVIIKNLVTGNQETLAQSDIIIRLESIFNSN